MLDAPTPGAPASDSPPPAGGGDANADAYFEVKATPERATLLVKAGLKLANIPLTVELLQAQIAKAKVVAGVDDAMVANIAAKGLYDKTHIVATGKPPVSGKDAVLEELVKVDADVTPKAIQNGRVDFKNIDNIHTVEAGTVLAVKHPATSGEPGIDVFGKQTPVKPGKDNSFKVGQNVNLSADGQQLTAAKGGFLFHQAGAICIGEAYTVKGDVGFKTGNIHYHGTVQVQGGVGEGFAVEADGDVTIDGVVDGSNVISNRGGVHVKQAVFGHGHAKISAKTKIHLTAVQDAKLECEGAIEVQKLLRNCDVTAGTLKADGGGCITQGGHVRAYGDIALASVGGGGLHTEISIVDREIERRREEWEKLKAKQAQTETLVHAMEQKLKGMKALAEKMHGHLSERMANELKAAVHRYSELQSEMKDSQAKRQELQAALLSAQNHPYSISIKEKVLGPVKINLYGHSHELGLEDGGKRWAWSEDGAAGGPLIAPG